MVIYKAQNGISSNLLVRTDAYNAAYASTVHLAQELKDIQLHQEIDPAKPIHIWAVSMVCKYCMNPGEPLTVVLLS